MWTTLCISCVKDDMFVAIRIYKESSIFEIICQVFDLPQKKVYIRNEYGPGTSGT